MFRIGLQSHAFAVSDIQGDAPGSARSQAYEEMSLKDLRVLADRTPGMRSQKKVGEKWVNKQKEELVEDFKAFDAKISAQPLAGPKTEERSADPASVTSQAVEEISFRDLWDLADKTPGMHSKKKVG